MRIALDARTVYRPNRRGTGKNLIDLYTHVAALKPGWRVTAYHRGEDEPTPLLPKTVQPRRIEMLGDRYDAWQRLRLPLAAARQGAQILHCPANTCPNWFPLPTVVTIHDLIPLDMPQGIDAAELRRFETAIRNACARAVRIITPSQYTRMRLIDEFQADGERVNVIPWAPDSSIERMDETDGRVQAVRQKYQLPGRFVLHFGANPISGARKNTQRVLEAWSVIKRKYRRDRTLVIVGLDDAAKQAFSTVTQRLSITDSVRLYGFAEEADLPPLLNAADVLAYPSLAEGFGLPVLDAWATHTVVVGANSTSIPEVAADAALLVQPDDPCAIAKAMKDAMHDNALRIDKLMRGRKRLVDYTWQHTAERFIHTMTAAAAERDISLSSAA